MADGGAADPLSADTDAVAFAKSPPSGCNARSAFQLSKTGLMNRSSLIIFPGHLSRIASRI